MQSALPYLPIDRRLALATGAGLPTTAHGAVLFADISGFTQLTNLLVDLYGPRRGAEEATRHLNQVYGALIREVHALGGSVVSFSGDGMLCWFPVDEQPSGEHVQAEAGWRALCAATALHEQMAAFQEVALRPDRTTELGLKASLAVGEVRRWVVGDPAVQLFDVLAGEPVNRAGAGDQLATRGESVLDEASARLLGPQLRVRAWRTLPETGGAYAVAEPSPDAVRRRFAGYQSPFAAGGEATPPPELVQPWLLPAIYARLQAGQERYLAELRPAVALFLRLQGLDLSGSTAGGQAATTPDSPLPTAYPSPAELLDGYVRWVQEVLNRYGAALVQVTTGDKGSYLYAAFGATVVHDDDPERAVAAALELMQTPPHLAPITAPQIGIARGRMRVGAYGSEQRRTFGVQGAAVNLAARLMMAAQPGQIVVDPAVATAVGDSVQLEELGPVMLKGVDQAMTLYRVVGMRPAPPASPTGLERRFVGRQPELAQLHDAAMHAAAGRGQVVEVYGPAGIGKSTLLAHLAAQLASEGWLAAQGQGQGARRHVAYGALGQLLSGLLGLSLPEPGREAEAVASLHAWVEAVEPSWQPRLPLLREVLALPLAETPATAALDPRSRQQATAALVSEMVAAVAARQPVLLLVDDSQWLDEATVAVLDALAQRVDDLRTLMVLARRTGEEVTRPPAWDVSLAIPLGGLEVDDLEGLVQARLGGAVEPITGALLATLAQGNPLYLEQVMDALAAAGHLVQDGTSWQLAPAAVEDLRASRALVATETGWQLVPEAATLSSLLGLPESLHELALARVDRLPEEAKLTLKVASVVGRIFEFDVLARAHPALPDPDQLRAQLALLHERELVMPVKADGLWPAVDSPEAEARSVPPAIGHSPPAAGYQPLVYAFQHNLTQEVVYETLLASQQQELHWAVGDALEQVQPGAVERLAHHYASADLSRAEVRQRALRYLDRAAAKARQDFANETALRFLDQALSLEERWEWHKARVELLHLLGRRHEEAGALAALASWPHTPPDELALLESRYFEAVNEYDTATAAAHRLLALAAESGRRDLEAAALVQLASIAGREGNYAQEGAYYRQALAVVDGHPALQQAASLGRESRSGGWMLEAGSPAQNSGPYSLLPTPHSLLIDIHYGLGTVYRQQGEYDEAEAHYQAALDLARQSDRLADEARILTALGVVAQRTRRLDVALQYAERSLGIRRLVGDRAGESASLLSAANVLTDDLGDYGRGLVLLKQALTIERRLRNRWAEASVLNSLGIVHLLVGRLDEAAYYLQQALAICEQIGAVAGQAHVLCNLGQVQREQGKLADAAASFARGLAAVESLGDRLTQAQYWSEMGLLALRQGEPANAAHLAAKAAAQLRELDVAVLATADYCTLAEASHALGDGERAQEYAHEALALLDACGGNGPDYPHRDYYRCALILEAYGDLETAGRARTAAYRLLMERADRISDPDVRTSYLRVIPIHAAIAGE